MEKPKLKDVTLFATDGHNLTFTLNSLLTCRSQIDFADTILFSETEPPKLPFTAIKIDPVGSAQNSGIHYYRNLPQLMKTSHALVVDWDSWIIHPDMWTDEFLQYDYIGARWPWCEEGQSVGNAGFCLVSKKMLETVGAMDIPSDGCMDADICRKWRPMLEKEHGIKFAPGILADKFSYERAMPEAPSFGFHGFYNFWRHIDDTVMLKLIPHFPAYVVKKSEYAELIHNYQQLRKFHLVKAMKDRLEKTV